MQENPYPPLNDYIRVVSHGTLIRNRVSTKNGKVWVCYEKDGKLVYERKECGSAKDNTYYTPTIDVNAQEAFYIGVDRYYGVSSDIKIFDASKAATLSSFPYNTIYLGILALGKTVELIDLTGCSKIKYLKLAGYNANYDTTHCNEIRINGCTSATVLQTRGQGAEPRIFGLLDCKNLEEIKLENMSPCYDDGSWIEDLDLRDFENLHSLAIKSPHITSLDNLPSGLTSLDCSSLNLSKADFSNTTIETISAYGLKVQDGIFTPPTTLTSFSSGENNFKQGDFSKCVNLVTFSAAGKQWIVGKLLLPPSIKTLTLGMSWGNWVYPMPDLADCTNLTSINCQRCTNIPNLDQQTFIDSLPTFMDGSTHTINLKNTGVVADTIAALEAKGWTVQI